MPAAPRRTVQARVRRVARSRPAASARQIAALVGCHPSTVRKYLADRHTLQQDRPVVLASQPDEAPAIDGKQRPTDLFGATGAREPLPSIVLRESRLMALAAQANPNQEFLDTYTDNPDPLIRAAAAGNPGCPPHLLAQLARDTSQWVQAAAVAHPRCPHPARSGAATTGFYPAVCARGRAAAVELAFRLATCNDWAARRAVAAGLGCPPQLTVRLAADPHPAVRAAVAARVGSPTRLLARLVNDTHTAVCVAATARSDQARRSGPPRLTDMPPK